MLIGVARPSRLLTFEATDVDFDAALTKLEDLIPPGWDILREIPETKDVSKPF